MQYNQNPSDFTDNQLDNEFRQVLYNIKPYIQNINDPYQIEQYRLWLDKLSHADDSEKYIRNQYLYELAKQIKNDIVESPFDELPPEGQLLPFHSFAKFKNKSSNLKRNYKNIDNKKSNDNDSWVDLSETYSSHTSIQCNTKKKNHEFRECGDSRQITENLQNRYRNLVDLEEKPHTALENHQRFRSKSSTPSPTTPRLNLDDVKHQVQDLEDLKMMLKKTHVKNENKTRMLECLRTKLLAYESKNKELRSIVDLQTKRILELELNKPKSQLDMVLIEDIKEKYTKEIEALKQKHAADMKEKEIEYHNKLDTVDTEYQRRIDKLERQNQQKYDETLAFRDSLIKQKDEEIEGLRAQLKKHIEEETTYSELIVNLKRCLGKIDKLMIKSEREYKRKIDELRQELERKDIETEMKLQSQKAELAITHSTAKQDEINLAINNLEQKYKAMLEKQKSHAQEMQNENQKVISELTGLLKPKEETVAAL